MSFTRCIVLELGEDEGGAGDLGDVPRAGGDVLEEGPALGEQGESSFSLEAQASEQGVPGAGADIEFLVSGGALDGHVDADSGALVAGVGQRGHSDAVFASMGITVLPIAPQAPSKGSEKRQVFLVRINNSTQELTGQDALDYQRTRWPA
jgi:hypothetical protein